MGATNHSIVFLLIKTIAILQLMVWTPFVPYFVAWIDFIITVIVTCLTYLKLGNSILANGIFSSMPFVTLIPVPLQSRKRTLLSLPRVVLSSMMKSVSISWVTKMEHMFQTRILATCTQRISSSLEIHQGTSLTGMIKEWTLQHQIRPAPAMIHDFPG